MGRTSHTVSIACLLIDAFLHFGIGSGEIFIRTQPAGGEVFDESRVLADANATRIPCFKQLGLSISMMVLRAF